LGKREGKREGERKEKSFFAQAWPTLLLMEGEIRGRCTVSLTASQLLFDHHQRKEKKKGEKGEATRKGHATTQPPSTICVG